MILTFLLGANHGTMDNLKKNVIFKNFLSHFERNKLKYKLLIDHGDENPTVMGTMTSQEAKSILDKDEPPEIICDLPSLPLNHDDLYRSNNQHAMTSFATVLLKLYTKDQKFGLGK